MESPINPALWKVLFNTALATLSVGTVFSIYHQKRDMQCVMHEPFRKLRSAKTDDEKEITLHEILGRLQADAVRKKFDSRLSAAKYGNCLVPLLKLDKEGANSAIVSMALKVTLRVYGADAKGRSQLNCLGGYKVLLGSLSEAHRQGNQDLMEEIAESLRALTQVDDSQIVLDTDVPEGAEGAHTLALTPATVKMLRILDPESPALFLNALTGIFANICTLHAGAVNIGRGTDSHPGVSFFLRLLEHPNRSVIENCVMAIRFMARAQVGQAEIAEAENVTRLAENLQVNAEPAVINSILTIVLVMTGSDEHRAKFFGNVAETSMPASLFELWVRSPEKSIRNRAEVLCRVLMRVAQTAPFMSALFDRFRPQIEERRNKDEQEHQRQMQQVQQNQFMQRMMMEQMGMDPSMMGA